MARQQPAGLLEAATPGAGRALWDAQQSEAQFRATVAEWAKLAGWRVYWTWRSDHSPAGFPDLVLCHPGDDATGVPGRLLFRELKLEHSRPSREQQVWLWTLKRAGADAGVWRPSDRETIQRELGYLDG